MAKSKKDPKDKKRTASPSDPNPTTPKKQKRTGKKNPKANTDPVELPPLTPTEILNAYRANPTDCYVVGPSKWVDNAKALAGYLGFADLKAFRTWLTNGTGTTASGHEPNDILKTFLQLHKDNYGRPVKASGENRINISLGSIWDQLANNSTELMPQMREDAQFVLRLKSENPL